jgi:hypothetical protein
VNVRELIELLEDCPEDAEVLLAHQPSWPLQFTVAGVWDPATAEVACEEHGEINCEFSECQPPADVVYIVEGSHPRDRSPYAPREAWSEASVW